MRRNGSLSLDGLDLRTREAAREAARRSGLSVEDWVASALHERAGRAPETDLYRRSASDLDAALAKLAKVTRRNENAELEAIIAAAAAESERQARDSAARTAVALDQVATWIEHAEDRLNETSRLAADRQDQLAAALSEALVALTERLESIDQKVSAAQAVRSQASPESTSSRIPGAPDRDEILASLKSDIAKLASQLERRQKDDLWIPAAAGIKSEIDRLQETMNGLATRDEVSALERLIRDINGYLAEASGPVDLTPVATSVERLQEEIHRLSDDIAADVHRRLAAEIDTLTRKVDAIAASGADNRVIDALSRQILDVRRHLSEIAEPQRIEQLIQQVAELGRQVSDIRDRQAESVDFSSLKDTIEDLRAAMQALGRDGEEVPHQLENLNRRIDTLLDRPEPISLDPLSERLSLLTQQLGELMRSVPRGNDALASKIDKIAERLDLVAEAERSLPTAEILERIDRLNEGLRQQDPGPDLASIAALLQALSDKVAGTNASEDQLNAIENQVVQLAAKLDQARSDDPVLASIQQSMGDLMAQLEAVRQDAVEIAERAARTALEDSLAATRPATPLPDLEALKQGFADLKALQVASERKTQQSLDAVRNALDTLVVRLSPQSAPTPARSEPAASQPARTNGDADLPAARLEAAVKRLHAAAVAQISDQTSPLARDYAAPSRPEPEEVLLEPGAPRPNPGIRSDAAADASASQIRANFIAAARRAAQAAASEVGAAEAPHTRAVIEGDQPTADNRSLVEKLRRSLDTRRRPLLFSLAAIVLVIGSLQLATTFRSSHPPATSAASTAAPGKIPLPSTDNPIPAQQNSHQEELGSSPRRSSETKAEAPSDASAAALFRPVSVAAEAVTSTSLDRRAIHVARVSGLTADELPATAPLKLREAALSGDPAAVYEIAARAAEGRGVAQDLPQAARLFQRAAEAGFAPAQFRIGTLLEKGTGVTRDVAAAKLWYERAAEKGNARAMHNLAVIMAGGADGRPDYSGAIHWFRQAAEFGIQDSQFNLAVLLARGLGTNQDLVQSYKWFAILANRGDQEAAKKRDEVGSRLTAAELESARSAAEAWHAQTADRLANEVPATTQEQTSAPGKKGNNRRV